MPLLIHWGSMRSLKHIPSAGQRRRTSLHRALVNKMHAVFIICREMCVCVRLNTLLFRIRARVSNFGKRG